MPLYEYVCESCKGREEIILPVEQRDIPQTTPCSRCGEYDLVRIPSGGIRWMLKGSGWSKDGGAFRKNNGD